MKQLSRNDKIRNIAIIAHVDHGKTTLVDSMFKQSGIFRVNEDAPDRVMDSMDLEKERGITIAAKNCAVAWKDVKINIIDTPGHADFGGEVERSLSMVDGVVLLVDASEGPLPQTRFVLQKALEAGHEIIVVINKIDRKDGRPEEVLDEVYDLLIDLGADEEQLDFPLLYAIGRDGIAQNELDEKGTDLAPLFNKIIENIPGPSFDPQEPFQMLVADLSYSDYVGRLAVGKVANGTVKSNDQLVCINEVGESVSLRVSKLQVYEGLAFSEAQEAQSGDIIVLSGIDDVKIGDTICNKETPKALPRIAVDEPTVFMNFGINTSPLAGTEGKFVQSSKIRERLMKETLRNVSIKVEDTETRDSFIVKGRGEFQMAIIIETMRREGYELSVGRPEVIFKKVDGKLLEPIEHVMVDCDEEFMGVVTEKLSLRKAKMVNMVNNGTGRVRVEFSVPSRSLIGYRDEFLTDTKGTGLLNSYFEGYDSYRGDFPTRHTGSIVSDRAGKCISYALFNLEPRGRLFIVPGEVVYEGVIVGEHNKDRDIDVNPCKEKKLSNMRSAGKDDTVTLAPVKPMTLEAALNFIQEDELVEVTPQSIRLRKKELGAQKRHSIKGAQKKAVAK